MGVGDLFDAEVVQGLQVHLGLRLFELRNGNLSVIDSQELDQLLVIGNLLVLNFNVGFQLEHVALLLRLGLKERLHGGLPL